MKRLLPALLLAMAFTAPAQLALNPGDVWTHSFSTMNFTGTSFPSFGGLTFGDLVVNFSSFESNAVVRFEMFEGVGASGALLRSGVFTPSPSSPPPHAFGWADLNGTVRLTMLTNACVVSAVQITSGRPNAADPFNRTDFFNAPVALTSPPPRLAISIAKEEVVPPYYEEKVDVSWWTNGADGYVLESTNVLSTGAWLTAPNVPVVVGNRYVVRVSTFGQAYFRLRK